MTFAFLFFSTTFMIFPDVESSQSCLLIQSSGSGDVYEFDPQTSTALFVVSLTDAKAIDVHLNNGYIFWSDSVEGKIKRSYLDGTTIVIISQQSGLYEGLAVDWKWSRLYWTDKLNDGIMVADLDGNNQQAVVSDSFENFGTLAIDPDNGLMFWNDVSDIKRATLDGNQRTVIIDSLGPLEEDFDLDRQNQRIFWLSTFDVIYSADYNGTNRKSLVHLILSFATGLAFSHPYLYFTDNNGLHKVNASTGEIVANYSAVRGKPYGVASFYSSCPRSGSSQNSSIMARHVATTSHDAPASYTRTTAMTVSQASSESIARSPKTSVSRHINSSVLPISKHPYSLIPETSSLYLPASEPQSYSTAVVSHRSAVTTTSSSPTGNTSSLPLTSTVVTRSAGGVMNTESKSDLVAIIFGGNEIFREENEVVVLNGSLSYDPDVGPGNHTDMNFTWFIGYTNENYTGNRSLSMVFLRDLNETNVHYFGEDLGLAIMLNTSSLLGNKSYAIKLVVSKDSRSSSFIQVIHLLQSAPPEISIQCLINCGLKTSPSVKISMESRCKRRCSDVVSYTWVLYEAHIQRTSDSATQWQRRQDLGKLISTPLNSSSIVIKEDTLRSGQRYRLEVSVQTSNHVSATSAREIATATAPSGGNCTVTPSTGISLETEFNFSCDNWKSDAKPLTYQFQYQLENGLFSIIYHGTNESIISRLLTGNSSNMFAVKLVVVVADTNGASTPDILLHVQVTPHPLLHPSTLRNFITTNNSLLNRVLQTNKRYEAVGIAIAVLQALSNDSVVTSKEKIEIQETIIQAIASLPVKTIPDLLQSSSVIGIATQDPVNVSVKSLFSSLSAVHGMTSLLATATQAKEVADIPLTTKSAVNLGTCLSNIMKAGSLLGSSQDVSSDSRAQGIDLVTQSTELASTLSDAVLNLKLPDEEMVSIQTRDMAMTLGRHSRSMVAGLQVAVATGRVVLPADKDALMPLLANTSFLEIQALAMTFNPFTWDDSKQRVNSGVITVDLKDENGKILKASDLSSKVHISIPLEPSKQPSEKASFFTKSNEARYHEINVNHEKTLIQLQITPEDTNENLYFYLRYDQRPTINSYDLNGSISRNGRCIWKRLHDVEREKPECSMDRYAPIQTLAKKPGKYFLAVQSDGKPKRRRKRSCFDHGRQRRSCVEVKNPPPTLPKGENLTLVPEYDPATDKNYSVEAMMGSCVYWSEERNVWASEGCEASSAATDRHIDCSCNHLTSFGGSLLVAPNPIDFDKVFVEFNRLEDTGNVAVIVAVAVVFFIYFLVLVIARRADKRDPKKTFRAVQLSAPSAHSYEYEIIINTGIWKHSGSTAKVAMEIYGSEGNSGVLQLGGKEAENKSLFCRGNRDVFVTRCNKSLGVIQKVHIGHDNTGDSPSWYLEDVVISDPQVNRSWSFSNRQWLALERGDGRIERVLATAPNQTDFKYEASKRWLKGLTETHIWVSVAAKPSLNRFTRVQRASCCLSVLLSAMLANAMFHQFDAFKPEQVIQVGPLKFSWKQVVVGVESAVVVNPINLLVSILFQKGAQSPCRNSRSKWFIHLAWLLCLCICSSSAAFTIFYSLTWGKSTSDQWLASLLISFAQDVAITEPVKIFCTATLWVVILRRTRAEQTEFTCDDKNSCKFTNGRLFTLDVTQLERMRKRQAKKENKSRFIVDVFVYVIFVFLLMVVCYGSRNDHRFIMTKSVRDGLRTFDKVTNNIELWNWMRGTFLPFVYAGVWYNGMKENQTVYIGNKRSLLVGMPRARQLRVGQKSCDVFNFMKPLFPVCYGAYNKANEDKTPFSKPGWNPVGNSTSRGELHRLCPKPWRYQGAEETDTLPTWGKSFFYPGGGFVADLGYDDATGFDIIDTLRKKNWLDQQTRAIIASFSIFNPSTNLLAAGTYFYEIQPSGFAAFFERLHVFAVYSQESGFRQFYLICILFLAIFVLIYLGRECYKVYQRRSQYFKSVWNLVEIVLIILCILAVVMYHIRSDKVSSTILKVQENIYANVSFQETIFWMEVEDAVLGLLTFVVTVKLLRFFRLNHQVAIFIRTLRMSGVQLVSFCFVLLIGFMAFLHFGVLIFGTATERYSSPLQATYFQFELILGKVKARPINDLANANEKFGRIFVGMILVSLTIILTNLLISLLNQMLSEVKNTTTETELYHLANEQNALKLKKNDFFFDSISEAIKRTRADRLQPAPGLSERTSHGSKSENRTRPDFDFISKTIVALREKKRKEVNRQNNQRKTSTDNKTNSSNRNVLKNTKKTNQKYGCKKEKKKEKKKVQFGEDVTSNQLIKLRKKHRALLRHFDNLTNRYTDDEVWLSLLHAKLQSLGTMDDSATVTHRAKAHPKKT